MFGTLRYVSDNKDGEFLEHEMGITGQGPISRLQHMACDSCRVKKIRCSGRRSGCYRCSTLGVTCTYSGPAPRKRTRKRSSPGFGFAGGSEDDRSMKESSNESIQLKNDIPPDDSKLEPLSLINKEIDPRLTGLDGGVGENDEAFFNNFDWHLAGEPQSSSSLALDDQLEPNPQTPRGINSSQPKRTHRQSISQSPLVAGRTADTDDRIYIDAMLQGTSLLSPPSSAQTQQQRILPSVQPGPPAAHDPCSCLNSAVFLLDELETSDGDSREKQLDSHLSFYREVLGQCESMLDCAQCRNRPENMTVLNLVLERQVNLSNSMVNVYLELTDNATSHNPPHSSRMSPPAGASTSSPAERPEMLLGDYDVAGSEWKAMVRVLIFTQMSALDSLLTRMKRIPSLAQRDSQMVRLLTSEQRNSRIARKLWPGLPESTSLSESELYMILKPR